MDDDGFQASTPMNRTRRKSCVTWMGRRLNHSDVDGKLATTQQLPEAKDISPRIHLWSAAMNADAPGMRSKSDQRDLQNFASAGCRDDAECPEFCSPTSGSAIRYFYKKGQFHRNRDHIIQIEARGPGGIKLNIFQQKSQLFKVHPASAPPTNIWPNKTAPLPPHAESTDGASLLSEMQMIGYEASRIRDQHPEVGFISSSQRIWV
ncbi:uncharacterized protein PADG_11801 [Paracoccidioides brasiliensis Pb18]|uniref:Uncharacterized protein n=1 Tax=Paracoccidioides brasiliensis (strain Pb18) TaxID=502780 RepID=A0A0A0HS12_PARBD|nr:uncharacterized protein PADG_11801 [Paracoccidioides brasiliensis Pb18]KGM92014.1 hypothetical protein PADG_11801 [Paracoccidioides brasiliensis Pb18]